MNYAEIKYNDIANGPGIRTSLFVSGCRNNCPGCFNKEAQDFNYGKEFTKDEWEAIINSMDKYHDGITLLGGDPFEFENVMGLLPFVKEFIHRCPDKSIWVYTGYLFEALKGTNIFVDELLLSIDVLVDGPFIEKYKDITLVFKGSSNQRIINVKESYDQDQIILHSF